MSEPPSMPKKSLTRRWRGSCATASSASQRTRRLASVADAMGDHRVHAILVEERTTGRPLGWVKAETLLGWMNMRSPWAHAHQAITESVTTIAPTATARDAMAALSRARDLAPVGLP